MRVRDDRQVGGCKHAGGVEEGARRAPALAAADREVVAAEALGSAPLKSADRAKPAAAPAAMKVS